MIMKLSKLNNMILINKGVQHKYLVQTIKIIIIYSNKKYILKIITHKIMLIKVNHRLFMITICPLRKFLILKAITLVAIPIINL